MNVAVAAEERRFINETDKVDIRFYVGCMLSVAGDKGFSIVLPNVK